LLEVGEEAMSVDLEVVVGEHHCIEGRQVAEGEQRRKKVLGPVKSTGPTRSLHTARGGPARRCGGHLPPAGTERRADLGKIQERWWSVLPWRTGTEYPIVADHAD
jgi:hypothetical protein